MVKLSRFRRYPREGYVAGVCAGIAAYLDWNVKLIRALAVCSFIFGGFFPIVVIYAILWYVMDEETGPAPLERPEDLPIRRGGGGPSPGRGRGGVAFGDVQARFSQMEARLRSMEECVASNDYELRRELRKLES